MHYIAGEKTNFVHGKHKPYSEASRKKIEMEWKIGKYLINSFQNQNKILLEGNIDPMRFSQPSLHKK